MAAPLSIHKFDLELEKEMKKDCLGVIYIGQSPRPENVAELRKVLGEHVSITETGALDGLPRSMIDTLFPQDSNDTLYTKLPSGEEVVISKQEVTKRTQQHMDAFGARNLDVILMFCTGVFHNLNTKGYVIFPSAVLEGYLQSVLPKGRLGVFTPQPIQVEQTTQKWKRSQWQLTVEPLIPSVTDETVIDEAAEKITRAKPDLIALDCMGYTHAIKERIREKTGIRTVLAVSTAARAVQELID